MVRGFLVRRPLFGGIQLISSKRHFLFLMGVLSMVLPAVSQRILVDTIKVVIYGPEKTDLVTHLDLTRPGIDGSVRSQEDIVYERLMFQEAMRFNMNPDEDAVDTYLREIQREHEMTTDDLKTVFRNAGYTFAQGRAEFARIKAVNQVVNFRVISQLTIPRKVVEAYYLDHPEVTSARYCLQHAIARFSSKATDAEKETIKHTLISLAAEDESGSKIAWTDPYWLNHDEIAEDKQFICNLTTGAISLPYQLDEGFLIFKVLEKEEEHIIPLEERYKEIEDQLRQPKFAQRLEEYKQDLRNSASFIYF